MLSVKGMAGEEKYFGKLNMCLNKATKQNPPEPNRIWFLVFIRLSKIWYAVACCQRAKLRLMRE